MCIIRVYVCLSLSLSLSLSIYIHIYIHIYIYMYRERERERETAARRADRPAGPSLVAGSSKNILRTTPIASMVLVLITITTSPLPTRYCTVSYYETNRTLTPGRCAYAVLLRLHCHNNNNYYYYYIMTVIVILIILMILITLIIQITVNTTDWLQ